MAVPRYTDSAHLQRLLKVYRFTTVSKITLLELDDYIVDAAEEIEADISNHFVVPVILADSPISYQRMRVMTRYRAASVIVEVLQESLGETTKTNAEKWRERVEDFLAAFKAQPGNEMPDGVPVAVSAVGDYVNFVGDDPTGDIFRYMGSPLLFDRDNVDGEDAKNVPRIHRVHDIF